MSMSYQQEKLAEKTRRNLLEHRLNYIIKQEDSSENLIDVPRGQSVESLLENISVDVDIHDFNFKPKELRFI